MGVTMGAQLNLYKPYYPDPNPKPDHNPDTNLKPGPLPNPNSHPHFGIVVRSKSSLHHQTDIVLKLIFRHFFNSVWRRFLCRILSSGVSHIKLTMHLLLKQM